MSTADSSDNWRKKRTTSADKFAVQPSSYWRSSSRNNYSTNTNYSTKSNQYSWDSQHQSDTMQNQKYERQKSPRYFTNDIKPSTEQLEKNDNDPQTSMPNDWINFSKQNAEISKTSTNTQWENDWDKRPIPERLREDLRPTSQNKRSFAKEEYRSSTNSYNSPSLSQSTRNHEYLHPDDRLKSDKRALFSAFISPKEVEAGLLDGSLYQGEMKISKNRQDAYVKCDELDSDIYIGGHKDRNRSLQGDLVAIKLLDVETIWTQKKERDADMAEKRKLHNKSVVDVVQDLEDPEDTYSDEENDMEDQKPKYCGEVVAIIERPKHTTYSGTIILPKSKESNETPPVEVDGDNDKQKELPRRVWFKPTDKRMPLIALFGRKVPSDIVENEEYYKTHLFSAEVYRWLITDSNPAGRIIKELGPVGYLSAEKEAVIADNSIIDAEFSPVALQGLPELPWSIPAVEYRNRLDLRCERVFSIDPITAKDLDDALHIRPLRDGYLEVGVHIADVTYFLKKESPLDTEAMNRGTSTYLADRVIPMLPSVLCEQLCSLNPGVDRLAFSVLWIMDKFGKITKTWFGRTIIKSCAKLAYEHAQEVIEGRNLPEDIIIYGNHNAEDILEDIRMLYDMSVHMRQRRKDGGSLSLHSVKLTFELDSNGDPISFDKAESKEANRLIEEFMLCANISVAQKIKEAFPSEALLRRHENPIERRLDAFLRLTDVLGLNFDGSTAGTLQKSFNSVDNPDVKSVLLILCIRAMQRAKYFCAGAFNAEKHLHYALNEPVYTHFTSPIRRYADVMVHRMLQAALDNKPCGYTRRIVQKAAYACNQKKLGAKLAQDADTKLYLATYLHKCEQQHGPIYKKAVVIMTGKSLFEIYIPEYGIESRIYMHGLPVKKFAFDKNTLQLTIFWKKDIPVTMHNEEKIYAEIRVRDGGYSDDSDADEEDEYDDDMEKLLSEGIDHLKLSKERKEIKSSAELIPPVMIDTSECTQCIQMFSVIDVRLQVNMEVSPPYINVYPLNPFAEKE
ncbi:hypothetical protein G6F46_006495 [Rhizopus delemar]|uniref:DIS3-like exonuclease 2 n=2 Tax=Rhizopus TaxID=4842 RepID=A0A9P7CP42_9FUNG|nr:hypothetical protein G6F55_005143 [Rhizopus delemar]KAG1545696.1 hypothetical protein G6F51_005315 [Rhizopus arrhizus]KAG1526408.1 hypothetical protein G6F52_002455 [Rhizopus delemar]KAG1556072.1 hypothetical protein G6F49_006598 [Rhizopus delemar]KAG1569614.1 hypothetical protein G6F50_006215 [Rhizopus delemar]